MEKLPRLTCNGSHKLLWEKSMPNHLQRLINGGYRRQEKFLTLSQRKKRTHQNGTEPLTNRCPSSPVERTKKLWDENTHLQNETPDSPSLCLDIDIVWAFPLTPPSCSSHDTPKTLSEISHSENPNSVKLKMRSLSEFLAQENGGFFSESTPSEFEAFHLDRKIDTDSEDQITWLQWDLSRSSLSEAEGIVIKSEEDHMLFPPMKPLGVSDTCNILAKMSDPRKTNVQADMDVSMENNPILSRIKEELPDSDTPTKGFYSEPHASKDSEKKAGCCIVKQKISPSSQLNLLQASNISSCQRMFPFFTEMLKDIAKIDVEGKLL